MGGEGGNPELGRAPTKSMGNAKTRRGASGPGRAGWVGGILFVPPWRVVIAQDCMLDAKLLRESPDLVRAAIAKKHLEVNVDHVLAIDADWRALLQEVEALRSSQKAANTAMAALPKGSPEFIAKVTEMKAVSQKVKERELQLKDVEEKFRQAMLSLPNCAAVV